MAQDNIPKNQIKSRNTIEQREHEDNAAARRVVAVDLSGEFLGQQNPGSAYVSFIRDGVPQTVTEDTSVPSNNRPLPVKLTGFDGDVVINSENLNLETQLDGVYDLDNLVPDSVGLVLQERGSAASPTTQTQQPTAIRGTNDTNVVAADVAIRDHDGNKFNQANPLMTSESYEKILKMILGSKWMDLAVYDQIVTIVSVDRTLLSLDFKEDGNIIGRADVNFTSDLAWDFTLTRYLLDDDGSQLLDDDDSLLLLE